MATNLLVDRGTFEWHGINYVRKKKERPIAFQLSGQRSSRKS